MLRWIEPRRLLIALCLLVSGIQLPGGHSATAVGMLAVLAALGCCRCARRAVGSERLAWAFLAAGVGLNATGEALFLLEERLGVDLTAASPAIYTAWSGLSYFVFVGFYVVAWLQPHRPGARAVRGPRILDALLLGWLLLSVHSYAVLSYRLSGGGWDRRLAGGLLALLLGVGAAGTLWRCRREAGAGRWQSIYALLAPAALCKTANEAAYALLREPGGAVAPHFEGFTRLADGLEITAFALLAAAAVPRPEPVGVQEPAGDPSPPPGWRDLSVPALTLAGMLGIPIADQWLFASGALPIESLRLRNVTLILLLSFYVLMLLVRQLLVQMENRSLAKDLHQESMRLRLLVDNIHDAVLTEDLEGRMIFVNERFLEMFGVSREEALGRRLADFLHPEDRPLGLGTRQEWHPGRPSPSRFEFRGVRRDGSERYLESSTAPVRLGGIVMGRQSVIRDITERRRAEERQRELVQQLEFFVSNMPLGCIVFDLDRRIVEWNTSATRIFGWTASEAFGRNALELMVPPELWPSVAAVQDELEATRTSHRGVNENLTKDGRRIECEWLNTSLIDHTGRVVGVASMVEDITERRSLEAQLRQSQKMEAVGVLAGGIAHDFNNLLTVMLGNVSLALLRLEKGHAAVRGLRDAERAAERAAELVRQLLGFSRKSRTSPRVISLNTGVEETVEMLRRTIDPRIVVETRREPELWPVEADPSQVNQVLMNLCVNARDAMPDGGRLIIATVNRVFDERHCRQHPELRPGEFVEVRVSDTGAGMDQATRARIFEPFFTTKEIGKGTGLGLAMVYGIVKQHDGWITVESETGRGSCFSVFLPRSGSAVESEAASPAAVSKGGSETILLVDDEQMILALARRILEQAGHQVIEASDGEEAIEVFRKHREQIDLILLDMLMPRKSGRDTLAVLHGLAPEVPVVLASGYGLVASEELVKLGARAFLEKPYRPEDLIRTVRQVMDSPATLPIEAFPAG